MLSKKRHLPKEATTIYNLTLTAAADINLYLWTNFMMVDITERVAYAIFVHHIIVHFT